MQNPFLNGLATLCGLMWYLVLCKDIQKDWSSHKKSKKYQGIYIGDIIVNIITLPLGLIKIFGYIIIAIIKGVSALMEVKIKDCEHKNKTNIILNNQDNVKTVPPTNAPAPPPPPKQH
ncbi:hypothetical protein [Clostridium botulinum]|nr:hypothetical protein [Clostridium botulinum]NFH75745.1 hypothetical protein [Clostridium botulinum]